MPHAVSSRSPHVLAAVSGVFSLLGLCLVAICSACSTGEGGGDAVFWPELAEFDELAYRADGLVRTDDLAAVEGSLAELLASGRAVTVASIPSNAADPKQVEAMLTDLTSLIEGLADEPDEDSMQTLVLGLHPVIENLMKAAGMPHVHANEGPHSGFRHPVFDADGTQIATVEVKLHDDAGDLEVWLTRGGYDGDPWRLPVDTNLALAFPGLEREVTLAVRDRDRNEDESGASTILDGTTDYFVFPGATEADATWLMGTEFAAKAELRVEGATTGSFVLRPHVHRAGDGAGE
ncbi:MAG: hypothetical protein AAF957_15510 [Planctomycetota bacterium]